MDTTQQTRERSSMTTLTILTQRAALLATPVMVDFYNFGMMIGLLLFSSASLNIKRLKASQVGKAIADERSRHVVEKSGFLAFLLLISLLLVSGIVNVMFKLNLSYTSTVYVLLTASILFWILFIYYLDKKGAL